MLTHHFNDSTIIPVCRRSFELEAVWWGKTRELKKCVKWSELGVELGVN